MRRSASELQIRAKYETNRLRMSDENTETGALCRAMWRLKGLVAADHEEIEEYLIFSWSPFQDAAGEPQTSSGGAQKGLGVTAKHQNS